jgi:hypothetical protein
VRVTASRDAPADVFGRVGAVTGRSHERGRRPLAHCTLRDQQIGSGAGFAAGADDPLVPNGPDGLRRSFRPGGATSTHFELSWVTLRPSPLKRNF